MVRWIAAPDRRPLRRLALVFALLGTAVAVGGVLGGEAASAQSTSPTDPGDGSGGETGKFQCNAKKTGCEAGTSTCKTTCSDTLKGTCTCS